MTVTAPESGPAPESASRAARILSRPVVLNGLTVPNRIVMAPIAEWSLPCHSARTAVEQPVRRAGVLSPTAVRP
ncbi:hypothetical protein ABT317_25035, partial [Streptomyces carpinensis]